jgi:hypothetical protein
MRAYRSQLLFEGLFILLFAGKMLGSTTEKRLCCSCGKLQGIRLMVRSQLKEGHF